MFGRAATWASWVAAFCVACGAVEQESEGQGGTSNAGGVPAGAGSGGVTSGGGTRTSGGMNARGGVAGGGSSSVATGGVSTGGVTGAGGVVTGAGGVATGGAPTSSGGVTGTAGKAAGGDTSGGTQAGGGGNAAGGFSAGAGGEAGAPALCDDYLACGCGCCGAGPAEVGRCYYPEAGESLSAIMQADHTAAADPNCANAGCSSGQRYACCWRGGPEPAGSATYAAQYAATAVDRITIMKNANDTRCGRLLFVLPGGADRIHTALSLPTSSSTLGWGLQSAYESPCSMSALPPPAIGAIGSLRLRPQGTGCVADVHITTFFARNDGVEPVYFDADGLALEGASPNLCP